MEDAAVGTPVTTVSASDLDLEQNGQVTYFLEMTSADVGHFVIDKVTGVITLARYVAFTTPPNAPMKTLWHFCGILFFYSLTVCFVFEHHV